MPHIVKFLFPSSQFLLGQMVDGKCVIETKHSFMAVTVTIAYVCLEVVNEENEKTEKPIHQHTVVIKSSNQPFLIKDGEEFPFHISVPIDLPPTIQSDHISIEHRFVTTIVKAKSSPFFGQKKVEEGISVNMLYPRLNGLSYFTKRNEFKAEGYSLVVNLERDIYSLGQNIRVNYLLDGPTEKDVQIPLTMSLVRILTKKDQAEMLEVVKHDDHIRINQPISLDLLVPESCCPTVKSSISGVNIEYLLIVSADILSLCCKRILIEGKIGILITDMQQNNMNFNDTCAPTLVLSELDGNYKEELKSVLYDYQNVLQTLLHMKFYKDFMFSDNPERGKLSVNHSIDSITEVLKELLSQTSDVSLLTDKNTLLPNYLTIRKITRMFQVSVHCTVNFISLIPPTPLRTSIYVNCLQMLNCYQNLLFDLYMKKGSVTFSIEELNKSIAHYMECIVEANGEPWIVELERFSQWLRDISLNSISVGNCLIDQGSVAQLKQLFEEVANLLYNIRIVCDTVSTEGLSELFELFERKVIEFIRMAQLLVKDKKDKELLETHFLVFTTSLGSYIERVKVLSFEPSYRTEKYWVFSKTVLSMWNLSVLLLNEKTGVQEYFDVLQCSFEEGNLVIRNSFGKCVENPCIYNEFKNELLELIDSNLVRLKKNYASFINIYSKGFFDVFDRLTRLLCATYLHPNVFSKVMGSFHIKQRNIRLKEPLTELFTRTEKFMQKLIIFFRIDTSRDPTATVYEMCHAQKRVVEKLISLARLCLLHGQIYSTVYEQMTGELQKFRVSVYDLLLGEFRRRNQQIKHLSGIRDGIQDLFFDAKQLQVVYNVLFEEQVDCSESADIQGQLKGLETLGRDEGIDF